MNKYGYEHTVDSILKVNVPLPSECTYGIFQHQLLIDEYSN